MPSASIVPFMRSNISTEPAKVTQDRLAALVVNATRFCQAQRATIAVQKSHAQPLLNMHHMFADHRGGKIESFGGSDKGARFDHLAKNLDARQCVHAPSLRQREVRTLADVWLQNASQSRDLPCHSYS